MDTKGFGGRWVDNAIMGIANDGFPVVVETAFVGVVAKVLLEEVLFGGRVVAEWAKFTGTCRGFGVCSAAAVAAAEGAWVFALIFGVGEGVNGVVCAVGGRVVTA